MSDLSKFGGGIPEPHREEKIAHDTRSDRAEHRRNTYTLGRCRAVSKSKFCRCGGAVIESTDGELCHYHGIEDESSPTQLITIDDPPDTLARWCGTKGTEWKEIPDTCRIILSNLIQSDNP